MKKFSQITYCIAVLWMNGSTIAEIHARFGVRGGKTQAAIRGLVDRLFNKRRAEMTERERAENLRELRMNRQDLGLLVDSDFIVKKTSSGPAFRMKVGPPPPPGKKLSKRRQKAENERRKQIEAEERARREEGFAPRSIMVAPLRYLFERGLLADPEEKKAGKADLNTSGSSLRRFTTGERLHTTLISAYSSGLKTQNYDSIGGGGGGAGVVIHAAVAESLSNIDRIRRMMTREEFDMLDRMLRMDIFVWQIPSKVGEAMVLEDVRRCIDVVSVFWEMMDADGFRKRWDSDPGAQAPVDRRKARKRARDATEAIQAAQRKVG